MFGYININTQDISNENKELYRSYYCGLCTVLSKKAGKKAQFLLANDMTFLVLLYTGLYELEDKESDETCMVHPMRKRHKRINEATEYAADMNILLGYHNLRDDWYDDQNLVKKKYADLLKSDYQRIRKKYKRQAEAVEKYMKEVREMEESQNPNTDALSSLTGNLLMEIFAWKQDEWEEELRYMGYYMGKFIYLMDAYEDMKKDRKKGVFNPLIRLYKEKGETEYETICNCMLTSLASECAKSFERLPILLHAEILRNILYSGIWSRYEMVHMRAERSKKRIGVKK